MTLTSRARRSQRVVAGLTLSAAAVASAFGAQIQAPKQVSPVAAPDLADDDASSDPGYSAEPVPSVAAPFAAPATRHSLRAPVSARGADAAFRLARPAHVPTARYDDIPDAAVAAYQRAAVVMEAADTSCHVDWQLIAAVGRVASDHGRTGDGALNGKGVVTPALVGDRLDGRRGVPKVADTDAGQLDGDRRFDRPVGPMQVLPSTWAVIGVDADGDGERNPQDIDDAALSAAVHLCSGDDDLLLRPGRRSALLLLDRSSGWARLVLRVRQDYWVDTPTMPDVVSVGGSFETWKFDDPEVVGAVARGLEQNAPGKPGGAKPAGKAGGKQEPGGRAGKGAGPTPGKAAGTSEGSQPGSSGNSGKPGKPGKHDESGAAPGGPKTPAPSPSPEGGTKTEGEPTDPPSTPGEPTTPGTTGEEPPAEPTEVDCPDGSTAATPGACPADEPADEPAEEPVKQPVTQPTTPAGGAPSGGGSPAPAPQQTPPAGQPADLTDADCADVLAADRAGRPTDHLELLECEARAAQG